MRRNKWLSFRSFSLKIKKKRVVLEGGYERDGEDKTKKSFERPLGPTREHYTKESICRDLAFICNNKLRSVESCNNV